MASFGAGLSHSVSQMTEKVIVRRGVHIPVPLLSITQWGVLAVYPPPPPPPLGVVIETFKFVPYHGRQANNNTIVRRRIFLTWDNEKQETIAEVSIISNKHSKWNFTGKKILEHWDFLLVWISLPGVRKWWFYFNRLGYDRNDANVIGYWADGCDLIYIYIYIYI